jgi:hypothetical protein
MRAASFPAGTARLALSYAGAKLLANWAFFCFMPDIADVEHVIEQYNRIYRPTGRTRTHIDN